ncbi:MAG: hypothetical protein R3327_03945 [Nitrosopumilaceae archaeon]|nr:hypothetical protein [Nitrosopumilaceae archaeon]
MLATPIPRNEKKSIGKDVKICLDCGSGIIDCLEFAISCENCGSLLVRGK